MSITWSETKTMETITSWSDSLLSSPSSYWAANKVAIVREGKEISPSLQNTLIWLTHKRPSDHKSADPVGPLCLVCLYMYTWSLWGFLTLLPFPFVFPLSLLLPPPPSTPLPLLFGAFETSEYRHVQSFGGPRGLRFQTEGENKETRQCPRCKSYLPVTTGEKLLNITKRLDRRRRSEDCLVCCAHNHTVS